MASFHWPVTANIVAFIDVEKVIVLRWAEPTFENR